MASPPAIVVKDQNGKAMAGVAVTVSVAAGGGNLTGQPTKTLQGSTPIGSWVLGTRVGTNTISVTAGNLSPATFSVESAPGSPARFNTNVTSFDGIVGVLVGPGPSATLVDANNNSIPGASISISVAGGGQAPSTITTDGLGNVVITTWTLGTVKGNNSLTMTTGAASVTFSAVGRAGPLTRLSVISGNNQSTQAGTSIPGPILLLAADSYNNGIDAQVASVAVAGGGGQLSSTAAVSDANGVITVGGWTLGKTATPQSLRISLGSMSAFASATVQTNYNIQVRFFGPPMTASQRALFESAAARLSAIINGDVIDVNAVSFDIASACGVAGAAPLNEVIDDLVIYASIAPIDGPGNTLARAGPCAFRPAAYRNLPAIGSMQFDVADLDYMSNGGVLQDVITHEMLHVLGIGQTLWGANGYLINYGTPSVGYIGSQARQGCFEAGGFSTCASAVPVENTGGAGTAGSHWRESIFGAELMTGYANAGASPISMITVGGLSDIGYAVNVSAADFFRPGTFSIRSDQTRIDNVNWENAIALKPVIIHPDGKVEPARF